MCCSFWKTLNTTPCFESSWSYKCSAASGLVLHCIQFIRLHCGQPSMPPAQHSTAGCIANFIFLLLLRCNFP